MLSVWILNLQGYGQTILNGIIPIEEEIHKYSKEESEKFKIEKFSAVLKRWQLGVSGKNYQTSTPEEVKFGYGPWMIKQRTYDYIPVVIDKYITLVEVFTSTGEKFGLRDVQVVVEIKTSSTGSFRTWAEIYYIVDAQIPALIIEGSFQSLYYEEKEK